MVSDILNALELIPGHADGGESDAVLPIRWCVPADQGRDLGKGWGQSRCGGAGGSGCATMACCLR